MGVISPDKLLAGAKQARAEGITDQCADTARVAVEIIESRQLDLAAADVLCGGNAGIRVVYSQGQAEHRLLPLAYVASTAEDSEAL